MRTGILSATSLLGALSALSLVGCGSDTGAPTGSGGATTTASASVSTTDAASTSGAGGATAGSSTSAASSSSASSGAGGAGGAPGCVDPMKGGAKRVIVFVWDGLRPDSINAVDTPHLDALRQAGVDFTDNHSTYPTFTMMNAASLATGAFPGTTGFYGNTLWAPGAMGNDASAKPVDFNQPAFTEDYAILGDLDAFYQNQLFLVGTLFKAAQAAGLKTAAVGKSGPAFLQDYDKGGVLLDEKIAYPLAFAQELQAAQIALPKLTPNAYTAGQIALAATNGDPTAALPKVVLADGVTADPTDASGTPYKSANDYLVNTYVDYVLPTKSPDLSVIWLRNPDSTQHSYGVGTANYRAALHDQDDLLGKIQQKLVTLGLDASTDLVVVSDHAHSNVSGPQSLFPLRAITAGAPGAVDAAGYSVSGDVRLADLLTKAGFSGVFDGSGCAYSPALSGQKADGSVVYPTQTDADGTVCGTIGKKYTTASFKVPAELPAKAVVIAPNGGSDYLYVPSKDATLVKGLVAFLQSREEIGAIFVDKAYASIPGTMSMDLVHLENLAGRNPDIIVSFNFDETATVQGMKGTEFESMFGNRGMHGSFGPTDVHNTLLASGPHFRKGFSDALPTGNVDVAPTIAYLFGLPLAGADGRPLFEALAAGAEASEYQVKSDVTSSTPAKDLVMKLPTSPIGADVDAAATSYQIDLHTKTLIRCGQSHTYFDYARAVRK